MATWTISTLEHNTADGGVIVAHWRVTEEDMMSVDYSKLVPMLVKEIQSLRARVAQLEGAN